MPDKPQDQTPSEQDSDEREPTQVEGHRMVAKPERAAMRDDEGESTEVEGHRYLAKPE
jgi:hypothetical protein